jgi:phytoene/squalene synthetase
MVQLNPYDGRLYFPGKTLSQLGLRRADLQANAHAAGMRVGGTWIALPETKPELDSLIELLSEVLHSVAPFATKQQ